MTTWGFNEKSKAETLSRFGDQLTGNTSGPVGVTGTEALIAKIPAGEQLDARSGASAGYLSCEVVQLGMSGDIGTAASSVEVLNTTDTDFSAGEYITCVRVNSVWMVTSGGGGGGGTAQSAYTVVANSGISAATWPTAGTGTGDIYELSSGGASWSSIGGGSVNVRNPWEETIDSGSVMTCYKEGDYYVVIQASCPSV